jgi:hypothetical protein
MDLLTERCYHPGMADEPENLILKQLAVMRDEIRTGFAESGRRVGILEAKVDGLAGTLIGVQRELRRLSDNVATLGAAIDDHTRRLDHIEKHLGIERPDLLPS